MLDHGCLAIVVLGEDARFFGILWQTLFVSGIGVAAGMALLVAFFAYHLFRATFRFGRDLFPVSWFVALAVLFSGAACFAAGPMGLSVGVVFLAVYGLGRWRSRSLMPSVSRGCVTGPRDTPRFTD